MKWKPTPLPTASAEDIKQYEVLRPLIEGMYKDSQALAGKKLDGTLSKQRIAMINRLLKDVKEFLRNEPTVRYLDLLDEEVVPKNADALLVLGQYKSALDHYHSKYTEQGFGIVRWREATGDN